MSVTLRFHDKLLRVKFDYSPSAGTSSVKISHETEVQLAYGRYKNTNFGCYKLLTLLFTVTSSSLWPAIVGRGETGQREIGSNIGCHASGICVRSDATVIFVEVCVAPVAIPTDVVQDMTSSSRLVVFRITSVLLGATPCSIVDW